MQKILFMGYKNFGITFAQNCNSTYAYNLNQYTSNRRKKITNRLGDTYWLCGYTATYYFSYNFLSPDKDSKILMSETLE